MVANLIRNLISKYMKESTQVRSHSSASSVRRASTQVATGESIIEGTHSRRSISVSTKNVMLATIGTSNWCNTVPRCMV